MLVAVGHVTFFRTMFSTVLFRTMFRALTRTLLPGICGRSLREPDTVLRASVRQVRIAGRTDGLLLLTAPILLAAVVRVSLSVLGR